MADDEGGFRSFADKAVAAAEVTGLAFDLMGPHVGPAPQAFVAPAVEPVAIVEQVETPLNSYLESIQDDVADLADHEAKLDAEQRQSAMELADAEDAIETSAQDDPGEDGFWADGSNDADADAEEGEVEASSDWAPDADAETGDWASDADVGDAGDWGDASEAGEGDAGEGGGSAF